MALSARANSKIHRLRCPSRSGSVALIALVISALRSGAFFFPPAWRERRVDVGDTVLIHHATTFPDSTVNRCRAHVAISCNASPSIDPSKHTHCQRMSIANASTVQVTGRKPGSPKPSKIDKSPMFNGRSDRATAKRRFKVGCFHHATAFRSFALPTSSIMSRAVLAIRSRLVFSALESPSHKAIYRLARTSTSSPKCVQTT